MPLGQSESLLQGRAVTGARQSLRSRGGRHAEASTPAEASAKMATAATDLFMGAGYL
jgi:hypothetical protein